jgi:hypothetical protein
MYSRPRGARTSAAGLAVILLGGVSTAVADTDGAKSFLPRLVNSSTIPANGDVNPYGVAFVPRVFPSGGALAGGDVLVSNFNSAANTQGTGTTIVALRPGGAIAAPGTANVFFSSTLPGLTTALGALSAGYVLVGNVPTTDGTYGTIGPGALQVLDRNGSVVTTWTDATLLDGPWDLAISDHGQRASVFVSSVLNGTVSRFDVTFTDSGISVAWKGLVAEDYRHVPNAAALVLGPTGLAYDEASDTLFVAATADNAIYAVPHAGTRSTPVSRGTLVAADGWLRGPLALRFAPNGDLLTANGDAVRADALHPSEIVELTTAGQFVREYDVDSSEGGAFGIDVCGNPGCAYDYAVIDDVTNTLAVYSLP